MQRGRRDRRSIPLWGYDYTGAGAYYVTICTRERECLLGEVVARDLQLSACGRAAAECWDALAGRYAGVTLDARVVMPNHLHGVILIAAEGARGSGDGKRTLGGLVAAFKAASSRRIGELLAREGLPFWQRNYL